MIKYVVQLMYQDFEFDCVTDAARFLGFASIHCKDDISSFRMRVVEVEKDGDEDE